MRGCVVEVVGSGSETWGGVMVIVLMMKYVAVGRRCCDGDVPTDVGWFCVSDY